MDFPSPHTPFTPESEAARMIPQVDQACSIIVSAAMQLAYSVQSPMTTISSLPFQVTHVKSGSMRLLIHVQYAIPACLGLAALANAPEACREAGAQVRILRNPGGYLTNLSW